MPRTNTEWIDLSLTIKSGRVVWPGDPEVEVTKLMQIENGEFLLDSFRKLQNRPNFLATDACRKFAVTFDSHPVLDW